MKKNNAIFDIGANDGLDGLGLALSNPHINVYAFEANPYMVEEIIKNKKKIEIFFNLKIDNYEIFNKAIADFNGVADFFISEYDLCSSLLKFKFIDTKIKISCEVITLEKFCSQKKIDNIIYLHVDTQGSDLKVLKGLFTYKKKVHTGVIETAIKKEDILYEGGSSYNEVKQFFKKWNFEIIKTEFNTFDKKEINVYFSNSSMDKKKIIKFNKFKKRFVSRIIKNRTKFKDYVYMLCLKFFKL